MPQNKNNNLSAPIKQSGRLSKLGENKNGVSIGCHVSIAGGIWNAPKNAADFDCETFQIFSRSPHGGPVAELTKEVLEKFKLEMDQYKLSTFVIHAPYIINFGSSNPKTFHGSISIIRKELERGSLLGAKYVMFHPGSFKDLGEKEGMKQAQNGLVEVLDGYKGSTQLLIEISAGAGQVIGDTFEELAILMKPLKKSKTFGGICFDTQHAFGSGYDLRNKASVDKTFASFDKIIGLDFLKMSHVNDSKVEFGSHKDRHEHIDEGFIGKQGFKAFLEFLHKEKLDIPLILETEHDKVETDIKMLKKLRDSLKK
jgi:deoxyribonuclease-4